MRQPCIQSIQCPCPGLPLTNFSSEDPDRLVYLGRWYGYKTPSPSNIIQDPCASFSSSTLNQDDADLCAQASSNECQTGQTPSSPCDVCRPPTSGVSTGISFDLPGFASTGASSGDPCCDPDFPEECCCNSDPSDPNPPDNPPPGDPDNPGQPGVPTNPPRMFANTPQSCTVTCPSGASFTSSVSAGQVFAISQALADANAHAIACQRAEQQKECEGAGGVGCDCIVLCLDSPADVQIGNAPEEGEEKTFEVVEGELPAGLEMDSSGKITGTPTETHSGSIDVKISTGDGKSIIMHTCLAVLGITTDSLPDGEVDVAYSAQLTASGSEGPYTFSCEFGLPTGLSLNGSTGAITGTPDTGGSYTPLFRVADACGHSCPVQLQIDIAGIQSDIITRIYCPTNPAIFFDINVSVWGSTTAVKENLNQEARDLAQQQNAQRLLDAGCGCVVTSTNDLNGINAATNTSGVCSIPCNIYVNKTLVTTQPGYGSTDLNVQGIGKVYWHYIGHCLAFNDCANPYQWWIVPTALPQTYANVLVYYNHPGHGPPTVNCGLPPTGF